MASFKVGTSLVGSTDTLNGTDGPPVVIDFPGANVTANTGGHSV